MIALDVTTTLRNRSLTGIQRVVIEYLRAFRELREDVRAVRVEKSKGLFALSERETTSLLERGLNNRPALRRKRWQWLRNAGVPLQISSTDVLFAPEFFDEALLEYLPHFSRSVAMLHDLSALKHPQWVTSPKMAAAYPRYALALSRFSRVVVPSLASKTDLERYWDFLELPLRPGVSVVEHGLREIGSGELRNAPPSDAPKNLLCLGTLEARKNHLCLLEACHKLWQNGEHFTLTVVGAQASSGAAAAEKILQLAKEGFPVHWRGTLSDVEISQLWRSAWAFVYPSFEEGYGLPVMEALSRGVPVVCGTGGALRERVREGGCEVCEAVDAEGLARGVKNILNPSEREARAAEARRLKPRSWHSAAKELLTLLRA